jgi:hypothetical protein
VAALRVRYSKIVHWLTDPAVLMRGTRGKIRAVRRKPSRLTRGIGVALALVVLGVATLGYHLCGGFS